MFEYIIYLWRSPFAKIVSDYIIMTRAPVAAVRYICPSYKFSMKLFIDDFEQINTYMYVMYVYDECWFANRQFVQTSQLSRFHRLSHGLTVGSSFFKGLQILSGFFPKLTVFWKKKNIHRQPIPMLLKNSFLEWLTKIKQAVAVLYLWVGNYCSLS